MNAVVVVTRLHYTYDALYRRESADNISVLTTYLYDALVGVEFTTGSTANSMLRLRDSGEVFAWTSGSSTRVPINGDALYRHLDKLHLREAGERRKIYWPNAITGVLYSHEPAALADAGLP